jgi:hypothetical protein
MHIASIGIDLGKATFHLVALGGQGSTAEEVLSAATASLHCEPAGFIDRTSVVRRK